MWYVVQVCTGTEESIRLQCEHKISDEILTRCFIPYYEEKKRIRGMWTIQKKVLFPGYVFMITENVESLFQELKAIMGLTKLLETGEDIVPLSEDEVHFLQEFGGEEQIVPMSIGIIEQDKVTILEGPLQGMEGTIKKIDRHKRKAYLEVPMFGRTIKAQVGVEIVSKAVE
ncbi:MAG: antiterminator LoaP [Hespellia sp.]|nr:antiterminator LoaP [Hespellia sp.]